MAVAQLFAQTYLIGIAVAMPVGAMGVLCIQRTLSSGWRAGMATGAGIASADGLYASVAAFGITAISGALVAWQTPLRAVGGIALVGLGLRALMARERPEECSETVAVSLSPWRLYVGAVALTLTNPMTIIAFSAVFMSAGLAAADSPREALVATAGVTAGSLSWWLVLTTGTSLLRRSGPALTRWLNRASAIVIAGFGVLAIFSAFVGRSL